MPLSLSGLALMAYDEYKYSPVSPSRRWAGYRQNTLPLAECSLSKKKLWNIPFMLTSHVPAILWMKNNTVFGE